MKKIIIVLIVLSLVGCEISTQKDRDQQSAYRLKMFELCMGAAEKQDNGAVENSVSDTTSSCGRFASRQVQSKF